MKKNMLHLQSLLSATLLLLDRNVSAFQNKKLIIPQHDYMPQSHDQYHVTSNKSEYSRNLLSDHLKNYGMLSISLTVSGVESILDDGKGHINSELAKAIYEWEKNHAETTHEVKIQFSTRAGLRLVEDSAREIMASIYSTESDIINKAGPLRNPAVSYSDLIQEGMVALLQAMSTYKTYKLHHNNELSFENYATQIVRSSMLNFVAHSLRPISLPIALQTTLHSANTAAHELRIRLGKEPTLTQVAKELKVAPEKLALYRKIHRAIAGTTETFVSVEDGMEVYDPTLAVNIGALKFEESGTRADESSIGVKPSSLSTTKVTPTNTEHDLHQLNTQADDWETQPPERIVAPLCDVITDTEELNNPLSYTHHFLLTQELEEFLLETLTQEELEVIQLRFGLVDSKYGGKGWSASQIGEKMGIQKESVVQVASRALDKLRKAALNTWEDDPSIEVSL